MTLTPHRFLAVAAVAAVTAVPGCRTVPDRTAEAEAGAPAYAELAQRHNERLSRLSRVYSRGVIELRWRDEDGRHFEQGNLDLWIDLPRHTALRVEKLGNTFLWLGSNEERFWLFDLLGDETVLLTAYHDSTLRGNGILTVRPLALLDLAGLSELPEADDANDPPVTFHDRYDAWVVTAPGQGGLMRIYFDRTSLLPVRVESLSEAGEVVSRSRIQLDRYRSVPRPGAPIAHYGRMATLIDITSTDAAAGMGISNGEMKLALDAPTGSVDNQPMDRVFDLDRLLRSMPPARIEGDRP